MQTTEPLDLACGYYDVWLAQAGMCLRCERRLPAPSPGALDESLHIEDERLVHRECLTIIVLA